MSILEIFQELRSTSSRNEKVAILMRNEDNELLKSVLLYAMSPYIRFHSRKTVPDPLNVSDGTFETRCQSIFGLLDNLNDRIVTGNTAKQQIEVVLQTLDYPSQELLCKVLVKDLDVGVQESTVSKVWPGLIPTFDLMLATPYKAAKIVYPAFSEPKLDGLRVAIVYNGDEVTYLSRGGLPFDTLSHFDEEVIQLLDGKPGFLDAEAKASTFNNSTSGVKRKKANEKTKEVNLHVFDALTFEEFETEVCERPYHVRKSLLENMFERFETSNPESKIVLVRREPVVDEEAAFEMFDRYLAEGHEGAMIKNALSNYEFKRSKEIAKIKPEETVDVEVLSVYEGKTGKNIGRLGGFIVDFNGEPTAVGGGFSDKQRDEFWAHRHEFPGSIIEVTFMEPTDSKAGGGKMRHSRFKKVRSFKGAKS